MAEIDYRTLNSLALSPAEMIKTAENEYHAHIQSLAKRIDKDSDVKIVLLAGPSGSGKTTTANLLADALRALGEETIVVSLDNYYKNTDAEDYPRMPDGSLDYECPETLHLSEITQTLRAVTEGKEFEIPRYDFKVGKRVSTEKHKALDNGAIIIEGLHALNPKISDPLPREKILKLFVSVSTNINDKGERILSGRKLRFVRRMVRDSIYRATGAERTLEMWKNVLHAEDIYLYPYKERADFAFNTFHAFEPCVMTAFAKKLITKELKEKYDYLKIVINALEKITPIDARLVPENSLIKEFIPGGIYENLY